MKYREKKEGYGREIFSLGGKLADYVKKEPVKAVLILLLAVQLCLIAHSNVTLLGQSIDGDKAMLFKHIEEIWRNKALFIPDWDYLTTLEFDCSSILALPFYMITGDIILSFGLSNIVLSICFVGLVFFLFRGEDSLYPLFCANLMLIPFRAGMLDYFDMLFFGGGQYIVKVAVPILTIGILHALDYRCVGGGGVLFLQESGRRQVSV